MRIYFILLLSVFLLSGCKADPKLIREDGRVFGTTYSIQYEAKQSFDTDIQSLFEAINVSLSTYIPNSLISAINRNESMIVDAHLLRVYDASKKANKFTSGFFDPTIGAVVNAWDFGPEGKIVDVDSLAIDSLMRSVGFDKVKLMSEGLLKPEGTFLDFNAIAKGYAVDKVAELLMSKGIKNYLVEIGGEMRSGGMNPVSDKSWRVGIYKPNFDGSNEVFMAFDLGEAAMATSGVYRKFKLDENGNRYAHIIDTKTGYPSKSNVLSVSVLAEDCMSADAYATAFQAMGMEKVQELIKDQPKIKVYFIYENENDELATLSINNFPED